VERDDLASLAGFFSADQPLAPGATVLLGDEAAHHARVRRLEMGEPVFVADGVGARGVGRVVRLTKQDLEVALDAVYRSPRLPDVHLLVPIGDKDRMLWCAEKCTELGATSWTPVMWNRSRSVSPRGEGSAFRERVRARMRSALVQSHGAWLPELRDDVSIDDVLVNPSPNGTRLVLDGSGAPIGRESIAAPVTISVGPEGGLESDEIQRLRNARFRPVSVGANVLRFETAAVAALAIVRAALGASLENANG
jgi:16S rRNA (uracil1498-N3)-methyltransferase